MLSSLQSTYQAKKKNWMDILVSLFVNLTSPSLRESVVSILLLSAFSLSLSLFFSGC